MVTKDDIMKALNKWIDIVKKPEVAAEFKGYNKVFQLSFSDIKFDVQMVFKDGTASLVVGKVPNPDMSMTTKADLFMQIASGEVNPMEAFMEGKIKPKGDMADLEKLQIFMDSS